MNHVRFSGLFNLKSVHYVVQSLLRLKITLSLYVIKNLKKIENLLNQNQMTSQRQINVSQGPPNTLNNNNPNLIAYPRQKASKKSSSKKKMYEMLTHNEKYFLVPYRQFSKRLFSLWLAGQKKFLKTENIKYPGSTPHITNLSVSALLNLGRQNLKDFDTYLPDGDPSLTN